MAKGKKETAREVAERVVKGAGKVARGVAKRAGGSSGLAKRAKAAKSIQKTSGRKTPQMPKVGSKPLSKPMTKPMTKPLTKPRGSRQVGPKKEIVYNLPDYKNPAKIAESKKRLEKISRQAELQKEAKKDANKIIRSGRNRARRIEVNEKKAKDEAYQNYRREKQGKRDLTPQEKRAALADSKKIAGGTKNNWAKNAEKQKDLRNRYKNASEGEKRKAWEELQKHIKKYGRFDK